MLFTNETILITKQVVNNNIRRSDRKCLVNILNKYKLSKTMKIREIDYFEDFRRSKVQAAKAFARNNTFNLTPWYSERFDDEL
jgi:hypothetical protein